MHWEYSQATPEAVVLVMLERISRQCSQMQEGGPISKDGSIYFQSQMKNGHLIGVPWGTYGSWIQGDLDHRANESGGHRLGGDHLGELEIGHGK